MARGIITKRGLTRDVLLGLATVGVMIIAGGSPYFYRQAVRKLFKETSKKLARARARKIAELQKRKLISFQELGNGTVRVELTHQGKKLVRLYNLEDMKLKVPKRWDGWWRIVMYDIPTGQKRASNAFREKIRSLGLYQLQRSVWVSPYECLAEIEFLCTVFEINIDNCVYYFRAKEIPLEREIRASFHL